MIYRIFSVFVVLIFLISATASHASCLRNTQLSMTDIYGFTRIGQVLDIAVGAMVAVTIGNPAPVGVAIGLDAGVEGYLVRLENNYYRVTQLIKESYIGEGSELTRLYEKIKKLNPNIDKETVARIIARADEDEILCSSSKYSLFSRYYSRSTIRELVISEISNQKNKNLQVTAQ